MDHTKATQGVRGMHEKGLAHRVVMNRQDPYCGSNLSLFMDNFYSGVELLQDMMKSHGMGACGTLRTNRKGLPKIHNAEQASYAGQM